MKAFHRAILEYLRENVGIYMLVSTFFLTGVFCGALLIRFMEESQLMELNTTVTHFMDSLHGETNILNPTPLLKMSLQKNGRFILIVWLLGLLRLGFLLTLLYLLLKGLALGFTVGFLVDRSALKGVVFCLAAVLPHNFLLIPAYLSASAISTSFSILKYKNHLAWKKQSSSYLFLQYSFFMFLIFISMIVGVLVEAYITPVFIKLASSLFKV